MMRENESDGAGGWWQPPEEDAGTRRPDPDAAPRPDSDYPDTIAFGTPAGSPGYGNQASYGNQAGYGPGLAPEARAATRPRAAMAHPAGRRPIPRRGGVPPGAGGCWSTWPWPHWRRASAPG